MLEIIILLVVFVILLAAVALCVRWKRKKKDDDTFVRDLMLNTAAGSATLLRASKSLTVRKSFEGRRLVLTQDPNVARRVFEDNHSNYIHRFGNDSGLAMIGMYQNGIIWNNAKSWKPLRKFFKSALSHENIQSAQTLAIHTTIDIITRRLHDANEDKDRSMSHAVTMDIFALTRRITFSVTLQIFFRLHVIHLRRPISPAKQNSGTIESHNLTVAHDNRRFRMHSVLAPLFVRNESDYDEFLKKTKLSEVEESAAIDGIRHYFKAWNYFLLRSKSHWDEHWQHHRRGVENIFDIMDRILALARHQYNYDTADKHKLCTTTDSQSRRTVPSFLFAKSSSYSDSVCFIASLFSSLSSDHRQAESESASCSTYDSESDMEPPYQMTDSELRQCSLEMLLAGTDTSSVTMANFIIAIASENRMALQRQFRESLHGLMNESVNIAIPARDKPRESTLDSHRRPADNGQLNGAVAQPTTPAVLQLEDGAGTKWDVQPDWLSALCNVILRPRLSDEFEELYESVMNETLRFKPVGPIAIRQAVHDDPQLQLRSGDGIIVHLQLMHSLEIFRCARCERWPTEKFHEQRWRKHECQDSVKPTQTKPQSPAQSSTSPESEFESERLRRMMAAFRPFGSGMKSCVGQHLAKSEMRGALFAALSLLCEFELANPSDALESIPVQWEVASTPTESVPMRISSQLLAGFRS